MSEANPTPGPWKATVPFVYGTEMIHICTVNYTHWDKARANARLIAAAPEMLAALKAVRSQGSHGELDGGTSVSDLVETAIAKAEGRAQ